MRVRIAPPLVEVKRDRGPAGLQAGDRRRLQLVHTDVERGFIGFIGMGGRVAVKPGNYGRRIWLSVSGGGPMAREHCWVHFPRMAPSQIPRHHAARDGRPRRLHRCNLAQPRRNRPRTRFAIMPIIAMLNAGRRTDTTATTGWKPKHACAPVCRRIPCPSGSCRSPGGRRSRWCTTADPSASSGKELRDQISDPQFHQASDLMFWAGLSQLTGAVGLMFGAFLPVVNPLGDAPVFLVLTPGCHTSGARSHSPHPHRRLVPSAGQPLSRPPVWLIKYGFRPGPAVILHSPAGSAPAAAIENRPATGGAAAG